jgi:hypothetical protein
MPKRNPRTFYVLIRDSGRKEFEIIGPTSDDGPASDAVAAQQEEGRDIHCQPVELDGLEAARQWAKSEGLKETSGLLQIRAESASLYKGRLPQYAAGADRERVVQVFCKGECAETTWAEMNTPYPGKSALKKQPPGPPQLRAKCLRCGYVATDSYNWPGRPGE